jgi:hypothetical protein
VDLPLSGSMKRQGAIGSVFYFSFYNAGPWFVFGIPLLLHGILYLDYHFKIKTKGINS